MSETEPQESKSIEQIIEPQTKELIATFTDLRTRYNITNPDKLPEDNEDVMEAMEEREDWELLVGREARRKGTNEAQLENNFLISSFYVDAGFTDNIYLLEVLDWISQDEQRALEAGFVTLASSIQAKIKKIIDILDQPER